MDDIKFEITLDLQSVISDAEFTLSDQIVSEAAELLLREIKAEDPRALQKRFAEMVEAKLDAALGEMATRTVEQVLDAPYSWNLRANKSMTLREAMASKLENWLEEKVDAQGRRASDSYGAKPRINSLVSQAVDVAWRKEMQDELTQARASLRAKWQKRIGEVIQEVLEKEMKK